MYCKKKNQFINEMISHKQHKDKVSSLKYRQRYSENFERYSYFYKWYKDYLDIKSQDKHSKFSVVQTLMSINN